MEWSTYQTLTDGLADFPEAKTIAFAGLGEPLLHPRLPEMIQLAHDRGLRTEMTSNAMLLTPEMARRLIDAGLDQFAVSIDGASDDIFENIRPGSSLEQITTNVKHLYRLSKAKAQAQIRIGDGIYENPDSSLKQITTNVAYFHQLSRAQAQIRIGIVFVAMRRNIQGLPSIQQIARKIKASFILVTNVLPYTADLQDEILYKLRPATSENKGRPYLPLWILPNMDFSEETMKPLSKIFRSQANLAFLDFPLSMRNNYCPFVRAGSVSVGWHGGISPCPPLMHSYTCFIRNREKRFLSCEFGRLTDHPLHTIWSDPVYISFRNRVRTFDFPPCTDCGGCHLAETNEEDCDNNKFPVCGDCLWARGVLRCP